MAVRTCERAARTARATSKDAQVPSKLSKHFGYKRWGKSGGTPGAGAALQQELMLTALPHPGGFLRLADKLKRHSSEISACAS